MNEMNIKKRKLTEYQPDPYNANQGSERGTAMIEDSIRQVGAARSLVASADDGIPIGNHTLQALIDAGIEDVIEVATDGKTVVVVKREDWESVDSPQARQAALFDNRSGELSLTWNAERLLADQAAGHDLSRFFSDEEIARFVQESAIEQFSLDHIPDLGRPVQPEGTPEAENSPRKPVAHFPLAIVLDAVNLRRWQAIKERVGFKDDTRALLAVLDYLEGESENGG